MLAFIIPALLVIVVVSLSAFFIGFWKTMIFTGCIVAVTLAAARVVGTNDKDPRDAEHLDKGDGHSF